jgi:hypothetical protein
VAHRAGFYTGLQHQSAPPNTDSNYGNIFSLWDRLLGSHRPVSKKSPQVPNFGGSAKGQSTKLAKLAKRADSPASRKRRLPPRMMLRMQGLEPLAGDMGVDGRG